MANAKVKKELQKIEALKEELISLDSTIERCVVSNKHWTRVIAAMKRSRNLLAAELKKMQREIKEPRG